MFKAESFYNAEKKIWTGPNIESINSAAGPTLLKSLDFEPEKVIQISANNGVKITNKQMRLLSVRACQNFQLKGLQQTDVIGCAASNSHYLAPIVLGSFLCGTALSTLDPSFKKDDIKHIYAMTRPKIIFCDPVNYEDMKLSVQELNLNAKIYLMKGKIDGVETVEEFIKPTGEENNFVPPELKEGLEQTAAILCSSGTTGLPKGVCMTHRMICRQGNHTTFSQDDVLLCYSTLYWLTGLFMLGLGTMNRCLRIIIDEPFTTKTFFNIVEKYRVTSLLCPPSQLALITQSPELKTRDLSNIRSFTCGGSAVPIALKEKFNEYLPNGFIAVAYGMSEIASCGTIESGKLRRMGSAGQVMPNVEIKIIDNNGHKLGIGEQGEICLRIKVKWPGYFNNTKATQDIYDSEGWVHSGDLGYFDKDGYLFIVDRKKDILKYKNFTFFPNEIEQIISELPDVVEVCVCGLPDIVYTDLPTAVIVRKEGSNLKEIDVFNYVAKKMADYKKLTGGVYIVDDLPKTPSGKVQRHKVKEMAIELHKLKNGNI